MGLVRDTGVKINKIFLTRLRQLIKMNWMLKLIAVLRCQRWELTNSGAHPMLGGSLEGRFAQTPESKQLATAGMKMNYSENG